MTSGFLFFKCLLYEYIKYYNVLIKWYNACFVLCLFWYAVYIRIFRDKLEFQHWHWNILAHDFDCNYTFALYSLEILPGNQSNLGDT